MNDFKIRLLRRGQEEQGLAILKACFDNRDFISQKWYDWYNYKCPNGENRNYLAENLTTGEIAGGYGLLPIKIKVNEIFINGSIATNGMVVPRFQRRGLFSLLGRYCLAEEKKYNTKLTIGVPNQAAIKGHLNVGWDYMANLKFVSKYSFKKKEFVSKEIGKFDSRVDKLIDDISKKTNFMVMKDYTFLNWRYVQRPDKEYKIYFYEQDGNVDGYMVLKYFNDNGYKKTHILDIMVRSWNAFADLIKAAEYNSIGRDELNCWQIENSIYKDFFSKASFKETDKYDMFIIHTNYGDKIGIKPLNWWITLGDNDVY